jgi:hypothetical protein
MFGSYILNRQRITGKLNEYTPSVVVIEILKAHAICIAKTITSLEENIKEVNRINEYRTLTIKEPFSEKELRYLASFVNYDCKTWTKTSLLAAYTHMMSFDQKNLINIVYGQKTYENPESYNDCMLYSVCRQYNIDTRWNMTSKQMLNSIKNLTMSLSSLQEQLNGFISKVSKYQLVNLLNSIDLNNTNKIQDKDVIENIKTPTTLPPILELNVNNLTESLERYKNTSYILSRVNPTSHYDAIILSALIYNINILESKVPFDEFLQIKRVKDLKYYTPVDETFRKRFLINPIWYDLTMHWEPSLNSIYDVEGLKKLCIYEGFTIADFRGYSFESLLQISRISLNVFFGKNVYTDEEMTPILLHDLKDLSNTECITLGNLETKELTTFSLEELTNHFRNYKEYKNPLKLDEVLDSRIVSKLKLYAINMKNDRMVQAIEEVENWKSYSNEFTERLRECYYKDKSIADILYKILECGMYMRGWKVSSDIYPLASLSTNHTENLQYQIEVNVHNSIDVVFNFIKTYNSEVQKIFEILPLVKYTVNEKTGERNFIASPDPEDGKSIFERMMFVKSGDKHKNTKSCIRLSSNILLTSVYFYICALGIHEPFRLEELEYIS